MSKPTDPLNLFMGWKAGNWVARQRGKAKPPVAYLYNGYRLPPLPEWDREKYPYIMMNWFNDSGKPLSSCLLYAFSKPYHLTHYRTLYDDYTICPPEDETILCSKSRYINGVYSPFSDMLESPSETYPYNQNGLTSNPDWANYDVLNKNGTLYLAASEPVPVYE